MTEAIETEILDHHQAVTAVEQAFIADNLKEFQDLYKDLKDIDWGEWQSSFMFPRHSLLLLEYSFEQIQADIRRKEHVRFANYWLLPLCGITLEAVPTTEGVLSDAATAHCSKAEGFFADTIQQVRTTQFCEQERVGVYHDPEGVPLALRKSKKRSSALTLQDMVADDLLIPRGTIVAVDGAMNATETGKAAYKSQGQEVQMSTYCVKKLAVNPHRLSPWAYEAELDRLLFAVQHIDAKDSYDQPRGQIVGKYTLADFRQVAQMVMETCGVGAGD